MQIFDLQPPTCPLVQIVDLSALLTNLRFVYVLHVCATREGTGFTFGACATRRANLRFTTLLAPLYKSTSAFALPLPLPLAPKGVQIFLSRVAYKSKICKLLVQLFGYKSKNCSAWRTSSCPRMGH